MDVADVLDGGEVAKTEEADVFVIRQQLEDVMARLVCLAFKPIHIASKFKNRKMALICPSHICRRRVGGGGNNEKEL